MATTVGAGPMLRDWRQRRRLSQLDLASDAGVSARHLSFVETGRSRPSREMILHLAEHLDVPLRERNPLLLAAGFAPVYRESRLDDTDMTPVREALDLVLRGHEPFPAVVVDRCWNLVAANAAVALLVEGVDPELLASPANVLRASLHPKGMAPRVVNFAEYSSHLLTRLRRQVAITGDRELAELERELGAYPGVSVDAPPAELEGSASVVVPVRLRARAGRPGAGGAKRHEDDRELSLFTTIATFGTALDITLAELAIESFFAADPATAAFVRSRAVEPS